MITLRPAAAEDAPALAAMNQQLIRDEGSRNPMALPDLEARMRRLLAEGWRAALFETPAGACGYALFRVGADAYDPARPEVFVRHFFIAPERRGQGLGRAAFEQLAATWPPGGRVVLEVLATNPAGRAFWERLGFAPYAATLTRQAPP